MSDEKTYFIVLPEVATTSKYLNYESAHSAAYAQTKKSGSAHVVYHAIKLLSPKDVPVESTSLK